MNLRSEKLALFASVAFFVYLGWSLVFGDRRHAFEEAAFPPRAGETREWEESAESPRFRDPFARPDKPDAYTLRVQRLVRSREPEQRPLSADARGSLFLNGTVVSGDIRCATINSSVYFEGDTFLHPPARGATYRVRRIVPGRVTLESDSGPIVLAVPDGMKGQREKGGIAG
jgi:hypothetical protein